MVTGMGTKTPTRDLTGLMPRGRIREAVQVTRPQLIKRPPPSTSGFRQAAKNAVEAGCDGVEIQGANSHLVDQFLEEGANKRTDEYGGSLQNRTRLLLEIVDEVRAAILTHVLGVRLSPFGQYGGIHDSRPAELFSCVIEALNQRKISYLHLIEGRGSEIGLSDDLHAGALNNVQLFRPRFTGPLISAAAYTPATATEAIEKGHADAIAFGRLFIANPDLVARIEKGFPLNAYDRTTFYGGDERGYTDYRLHEDRRHAASAE